MEGYNSPGNLPLRLVTLFYFWLQVGNLAVRQLCEERVVVAVNGRLPGPTIQAYEGDTLVVHVVNKSPYNLTMHW